MQDVINKYLGRNYKGDIDGNIISYKVDVKDIVNVCSTLYNEHKLHLKTIVATHKESKGNCFFIKYIFLVPGENVFLIPYIELIDSYEFPSLIKSIHETSNYEREIMTFFGLIPVSHLDPRPTVLHENWPADVYPLRKDFKWDERPEISDGKYIFKEYSGEGIYEMPVGPIHAGIIEPGHFRFSLAGENMMSLEPRLGYTHKGTEKLFEHLDLADKIKLSERVSGDSSFSHSLAFCQGLESLSGVSVPERAKYLRVIYSELERIANHVGDMGAMLGDTGYNVGRSSGDYLREMIMQWNDKLTGSRFLRGVNTKGGVLKDNIDLYKDELCDFLDKFEEKFLKIIDATQNSDSILNRMVTTGVLNKKIAEDHGVLGVGAKSVGISKDLRVDCPYAVYSDMPVEIYLKSFGDVYARFEVKYMEVRNSIQIIKHAIEKIPLGNNMASDSKFKKDSCAIGMVEGWRGDIVYYIETDDEGNISRVKVRDPSFLNWSIFAYVIKNNIIPDFPLINKSFNLSYSGNDL